MSSNNQLIIHYCLLSVNLDRPIYIHDIHRGQQRHSVLQYTYMYLEG